MTENTRYNPGKGETHYTCTSTPLEGTPGSKREHINTTVLNEEHIRQTGTPVAKDPLARVIQYEQAIRRSKRKG